MTGTIPQINTFRKPQTQKGHSKFTIASALNSVTVLLLLCMFVEYVLHLADGFLIYTSFTAVLTAVALSLIDAPRALALVPFFAIVSPMGTVQLFDSVGARVSAADVFIIVFGVAQVASRRRIYLVSRLPQMLIVLLIALIGMSWLTSMDRVASSVAILALLEYFLVFVATTNICKEPEEIGALLRAWVYAVTAGSALLIWSYFNGEVLLIGASDAYRQYVPTAMTSSSVLYRATYFVTGFIFPLAVCVGILFTGELSEFRRSRSRFVSLGRVSVLLLVNLVALVLNGSKTTIVSVVVAGMVAVFMLRRRMLVLLTAPLIVGLTMWTAGSVLGENQVTAYLDRIQDQTSFRTRLRVWDSTLTYIFASSKTALLGNGPDSSVRLIASGRFGEVFNGEGAVDNHYLYVAFDYGLPAAITLVMLVTLLMLPLKRAMFLRRRPKYAVAVFSGLLIVGVMGVTQMLPTCKPGFIVIQLLAFAIILGRDIRVRRGVIVVANPSGE